MSCLLWNPELLLDLDLDREAVAVPAALAGDVAPAHGVEPGVDVLEEAGPHVVDARAPVGGGRAFVEHPLGCALAPAQALGEDVVGVPARQDRVFEGDEVQRRRNGFERHPGTLRAVSPLTPQRFPGARTGLA